MASKPVILIVHGAWHTPSHFSLLITHLQSQGYEALCPFLPTCNNVVLPNPTMYDDIAVIRKIVEKMANQGKEIVVLLHSYGGVVGTDALAGLGKKDAAAGGIIRIIYMCAFIPFEDESLNDIFGGNAPPFLMPQPDGTVLADDPAEHFYSDLEPDDQQHWVSALVAHSFVASHSKVTKAAWREIPLTYFYCEGDRSLSLELQEMMVGRIEKEKVKVHIESCTGNHLPFLSMLEKVVEDVVRVAGGIKILN